MSLRSIEQVLEETPRLHEALLPLWEDLPVPSSRRTEVVHGYCALVRQHTCSQWLLARAGRDVSATTLVRPAFEALVRGIWCMAGAEDAWVEKFLTPTQEAVASDAETVIGPPVQKMLDDIRQHHPEHIHRRLVDLKTGSWRAMHSYVHGGIRPVLQSRVDAPELTGHALAGVIINANSMLAMATNLVRMSSGIRTPQLPEIQKRHAACLPPS